LPFKEGEISGPVGPREAGSWNCRGLPLIFFLSN